MVFNQANRGETHMESKDWHPADIIAALHKKGMTLAALSRRSGYASSTLNNALVRPWPKGEQIIAEELDVTPQQIWPSRYHNRLRVTRKGESHQF